MITLSSGVDKLKALFPLGLAISLIRKFMRSPPPNSFVPVRLQLLSMCAINIRPNDKR